MVLVIYYVMYVHNNTDLIDLYPMKKQQDFFSPTPCFYCLKLKTTLYIERAFYQSQMRTDIFFADFGLLSSYRPFPSAYCM